jgi:hypothetical protein
LAYEISSYFGVLWVLIDNINDILLLLIFHILLISMSMHFRINFIYRPPIFEALVRII